MSNIKWKLTVEDYSTLTPMNKELVRSMISEAIEVFGKFSGSCDITNNTKNVYVCDIFYNLNKARDDMTIMVTMPTGKDFSIATIKIPEDTSQEYLYELAHDIAYDLGYKLEGDVDE